jgi:hypothetical protein
MRAYLQITALIFGVVAGAHALRLGLNWSVMIAGWDVPPWISGIGVALTGTLCAWAIHLLTRNSDAG